MPGCVDCHGGRGSGALVCTGVGATQAGCAGPTPDSAVPAAPIGSLFAGRQEN